jgi:hypothetical protein
MLLGRISVTRRQKLSRRHDTGAYTAEGGAHAA